MMLRPCADHGGSALYFEFADPLEIDHAGAAEKSQGRGTCIAGNEVLAMEHLLSAAIDGTGGELRLVLSCERTAESAASISAASVPPLFEPCGIWVSLDANQER
jgi:hypothetical protein